MFTNEMLEQFVVDLKTPPHKWEKALAAIDNLRNLPDDYDGNGGKAPSGRIVDEALKCAKMMQGEGRRAPQDVYPVDDDICLEWHKENIIDRILIEDVGLGTRMISELGKETQWYEVKW